MNTESTPTSEADAELSRISSQWVWFLLLGVVMVILGAVAIGSGVATFYVSAITVILFGFLLLFAGTMQIISSFWAGQWSGFLLHLLVGILYVVVGFLIVDSPIASMMAITLILAALLIIGGLFRIVAALFMRFEGWGWVLLNGVIAILLGILIKKGWPESSTFVIGLFVGIDMLFNGFSWIMFSLGIRGLATAAAEE